MGKIIDLRSDTVTLPSNEMRHAITNAELGDDVFQEDPTVNKLETTAAEIMGKEAGLLVPSGTMGNLTSLLAHCERGTELILGDKSHTFMYEGGGISAFGGIHSRQLKNNDDGTIDLPAINSAVRVENDHFPRTSAISLENTHNMCFGSPLSVEYISSVSEIARENGLKLHIDGARIFNAAIALTVDVKELVKDADSVTFCLSKGLAAPVGSVVCGSKEFIYKVRRNRKALGGGMRQAGILAAAGLFAIETMLDQIKEDHNNAQRLAEGITQIEGISVDTKKVRTNIVYFELISKKFNDKLLLQKMAEKGVLFFDTAPNRFRLVTHYGVSWEDVVSTLDCFQKVLA